MIHINSSFRVCLLVLFYFPFNSFAQVNIFLEEVKYEDWSIPLTETEIDNSLNKDNSLCLNWELDKDKLKEESQREIIRFFARQENASIDQSYNLFAVQEAEISQLMIRKRAIWLKTFLEENFDSISIHLYINVFIDNDTSKRNLNYERVECNSWLEIKRNENSE